MPIVTIEEAQASLPELIDKAVTGEEVVITRNDRPVAMLIGQVSAIPQPIFGRGRGKLIVISEDDEHLKDFAEYTTA